MIRATSLLFWFLLTIAVSAALYNTSYRVQDLRKQLHTIEADIAAEQRNIHVLKAEWVYLANPARIEQEARKHLALQPTAPKQIARLENLSALLPVRIEPQQQARAADGLQRTANAATGASAFAVAAGVTP
jgi:cell division protein FtsL